jgi:hypothetical protein
VVRGCAFTTGGCEFTARGCEFAPFEIASLHGVIPQKLLEVSQHLRPPIKNEFNMI